MKPTTEILARISQNSLANKEEVFTKLYRYLLRPNIYFVAYKNLYANNGAATKGVNEDTADGFSEAKIDSIIKALADETYQPMPVRRTYIQKKNNRKKLRPLGIPTFTDKLVQEVLRMILEAVYEPIFLDVSHGFRPKRSCHTALKQLRREFNGTRWFVEGDIKGCFDNINHTVLVGLLSNKIKDARITKLIYKFLKAGYLENWQYHKTYSSTPQGGIISPLLANIYLHELDKFVMKLKSEFVSSLQNDQEFSESEYAEKIRRLAKEQEAIYDPDFGDMLRVSFMHQFRRGRLADLVSLLSGRNFKTKEYQEDIVVDSYQKLDQGILNFINEYNFKQFLLAIKGAGFISNKLLNSNMTLDFAYTLYLILASTPEIPKDQIKRFVQKWFVLSTLTSRYTASPESQMHRDMQSIEEKGFLNFFAEIEASALSESFWRVTLPQNLETSSVNSPGFRVFLAAQVYCHSDSLFMNGMEVRDLLLIAGDIHHIFPRAYLKKQGIDNRARYNQVANYIYLDTQVNKAIGDQAPCEYFGKVIQQCETKAPVLGNVVDTELLKRNLDENCIPHEYFAPNRPAKRRK
jgi:retron-type reverse transcriptase